MLKEINFSDYIELVNKTSCGVDPASVERFISMLYECYQSGNTVFIVGNGGSAANASHFCEDLAKGTLTDLVEQKRFRVISLTDCTPAITAWANDVGYDKIFEQQLRNLALPGDLLIAISGSGKSPNVLNAVDYANATGMNTIGMTGYDGGLLSRKVKHNVHVDLNDMGTVEAIHDVILHYAVIVLKEKLKGYNDGLCREI